MNQNEEFGGISKFSELFYRLYLLGAFFLLSACSAFSPSRAAYPIIESEISGYPIAWLDNERVLLSVSIRNEAVPTDATDAVLGSRLVIWNVRTNSHEWRQWKNLYCYDRGHVLYEQKGEDGLYRVFEGSFGEEKQTSVSEQEWRKRYFNLPEALDRRTCLVRLPPEGEWSRQKRDTFVLRPEHGLIDRGTVRRNRLPRPEDPFVRYVPSDGRPPVELPIRTSEDFRTPIYVDFNDSYLLVVDRARELLPQKVDGGRFFHFYRLDPRLGTTEKLSAGDMPDGVQANDFWLTRAGVVAKSDSMDARRTTNLVGHAGLYLLHPKGAQKLTSGAIGATEKSLSPDGCRLSFQSNPMRDWRGKIYWVDNVLKMINLCTEAL